MKAALVTVALTLALTSVAMAVQPIVRGAGARSCGAWISEEGGPYQVENHEWLLGYISAFNTYALTVDADVTQGIDIDGLYVWMDNYCRAHPLDLIQVAANALISELQHRSGVR